MNSSNTQTNADGGLVISPVIAQSNLDFRISVITTTTNYNQNIFNKAYQNGLTNYLKTHPTCSENVKG
jgi:hypothetical protein